METTLTKQRVRYKRISMGVYLYIKSPNSKVKGNTYRVIKRVDGKRLEGYFSNKRDAIKAYKTA